MAGKVTKAELIEAIHASTTLNRKDIHGLIDSLFEEIKGAILSGKTVELRGFGTFEVKLRKGRKALRVNCGDSENPQRIPANAPKRFLARPRRPTPLPRQLHAS